MKYTISNKMGIIWRVSLWLVVSLYKGIKSKGFNTKSNNNKKGLELKEGWSLVLIISVVMRSFVLCVFLLSCYRLTGRKTPTYLLTSVLLFRQNCYFTLSSPAFFSVLFLNRPKSTHPRRCAGITCSTTTSLSRRRRPSSSHF